MSYVILKEGREKSVLQKHPWIFSGAIDSRPDHTSGEVLGVYSFHGKLLGYGYFHPTNSIAGRMLDFGSHPHSGSLQEWAVAHVKKLIDEAIVLRSSLAPAAGRRLINGEGDGLPGLIVDQYDTVLVLQISTAGMELLKPAIIQHFTDKLPNLRALYEKSTSFARHQEGLQDVKKLVYGQETPEVIICENGIPLIVLPMEGQKTGFFLDQRNMREKVMKFAQGKRVLNCFAYTGAFSLAALKGGATLVDSVEISKEACQIAARHAFDPKQHTIIEADAFQFLQKDPLNYDLVILDPPAFVKKKSDLSNGLKGYHAINRLAFQKMPPHSILFTSSCSSHVTATLFQQLIFQAAAEAGRFVRILGKHEQAIDHPVSIFHPEGDYLKSLTLYVN